MAKRDRGTTLSRLQAAARLSRTALAARLIAHGFYAGQEQLMIALNREDGLTPSELSNRLGVRPPTVTKTIGRLQMQGMVDKRSSNSDQRQAHIFLTGKGREAIKAIEKSIRRTEKLAFKGIDKKEQKALLKLLARIEGNLAGAAPEADELEEDEAEVEAAPS